MSKVEIVSLTPIGYYMGGEPRYNFHTSFPSKNVRALGQPRATPEEAFEEGKKFVDEYQKSTFPGGMGTVIGVTKLGDGKFDAVVNTYYSFT
jgi:hypothetical protein